jgi:uncharacterized damage-inducible protein DinB
MATVESGIIEAIIGEMDHEAVGTRKTLERVPADKFDYKPHPKSMGMGILASHLAEIPKWTTLILTSEEYAIPDDYKPWIAKSAQELVETFDTSLAAAKAALSGYPVEKLMQPWRLIWKGEVVFELPRVVVLRNLVLNHSVHHRAQLGVYLRLLDVPVPGVYGPSADDTR